MTIKYQVKTSQLDTNEGRAYSNSFYVDNSATDDRIALGNLFTIKTDGDSDANVGEVVPTIVEASATDGVPAVGFVWRPTGEDIDQTERQRILNEDPYLYVYGSREDQEIVPIKRGMVVVMDDTREYHFNTTMEVITGATIEVAGGALDTIISTVDLNDYLRVGDRVNIGGVMKEILTIAVGGLTATVTVAFAGAVAALTPIYIDGDLYRPVYLGENGLFTVVTPQTGAYMQIVGYVENGNNILVNLELDITGKVVA